jgi:hypothetical protein
VVRAAGGHASNPGSILGRDALYSFGCIPQCFESASAEILGYIKTLIYFICFRDDEDHRVATDNKDNDGDDEKGNSDDDDDEEEEEEEDDNDDDDDDDINNDDAYNAEKMMMGMMIMTMTVNNDNIINSTKTEIEQKCCAHLMFLE